MTALCVGRDAEWWDSLNDGARLAFAICRVCPTRFGCLNRGPRAVGVIRGGVAFDDFGHPLAICPTCGYPRTGRPGLTCSRCEAPTLGRWLGDIRRWHADGIPDCTAGRWIGTTGKQLRDTRRIRGQQTEAAA